MSRYKKSKSSPPHTPSEIEQQQEQWRRRFDSFSPEKQHLIVSETIAAQEACGSRLAVARHLSLIHDALCLDLKTSKQKREWTLFLKAVLPGLALSRSQVFKDIKAWRVAQETFPAQLLDEFFANGYALSVRPTVEQPLGKMTEPCKHVLEQLGDDELSLVQYRMVLSEAANIVKDNAKKNRAPRTPESAEEKRDRLLADFHNLAVGHLEDLAKAIEPGESYTSMRVRDDLEIIVRRLMVATGVEALELEPRSLPEGYRSLNLPALAPKPRKTALPRKGARKARVAKRESLHSHETVADNGTTPVSTTVAEEEVPSLV